MREAHEQPGVRALSAPTSSAWREARHKKNGLGIAAFFAQRKRCADVFRLLERNQKTLPIYDPHCYLLVS